MGFRRKLDKLEPTKVPTAMDVAWSAGIYEGEGCCQCSGRGRFGLRVTQKDPEILYRLRDWFGGSITRQGVCKVWLACGDRARYFIALIYPFLTARRRFQVDSAQALEFLKGHDPAYLSANQIYMLLDSRPARARKRNVLSPEEAKQHSRDNSKRWLDARPENRQRNRDSCTARRARLKFDRLNVTASVANPERVN